MRFSLVWSSVLAYIRHRMLLLFSQDLNFNTLCNFVESGFSIDNIAYLIFYISFN